MLVLAIYSHGKFYASAFFFLWKKNILAYRPIPWPGWAFIGGIILPITLKIANWLGIHFGAPDVKIASSIP